MTIKNKTLSCENQELLTRVLSTPSFREFSFFISSFLTVRSTTCSIWQEDTPRGLLMSVNNFCLTTIVPKIFFQRFQAIPIGQQVAGLFRQQVADELHHLIRHQLGDQFGQRVVDLIEIITMLTEKIHYDICVKKKFIHTSPPSACA